MKTAALFSVFLSAFYVAFAQKETTFVLSLEGYETTEKATIPFGFIKVIDARFEQKILAALLKTFHLKP